MANPANDTDMAGRADTLLATGAPNLARGTGTLEPSCRPGTRPRPPCGHTTALPVHFDIAPALGDDEVDTRRHGPCPSGEAVAHRFCRTDF